MGELDWDRIHTARDSGTLAPAITHVERSLLHNRGYLGALGENELASLIIHNLVGDGWTLTPPEDT